MPDSEILGRLLAPDAVLVTSDRILHNQAVSRGFRSYFLDENGKFRYQRLPGVPAPEPLPAKRHAPLAEDYSHPPNPIVLAFKSDLAERDFKRYRTRRRRIRSYFGSETQISLASMTIGARGSERGNLCGFLLALAGGSGVKGIRASESYAVDPDRYPDPAHCVIHALRDLYLLQLENIRTELFIIPSDALALCTQLAAERDQPAARGAAEALRILLGGLQQVNLLPCVKGRFFEAMESKLDQLSAGRSNELVPVRFDRVVNTLLHPPSRHTNDPTSLLEQRSVTPRSIS